METPDDLFDHSSIQYFSKVCGEQVCTNLSLFHVLFSFILLI